MQVPAPLTNCPCCGQSLADITGPLVYNNGRMIVHDGKMITLSNVEADFFMILFKHWPGTVAKERIFDALYWRKHESEEPEMKTIDVHAHKLRRKIRAVGLDVLTDWGSGYRLGKFAKEAA